MRHLAALLLLAACESGATTPAPTASGPRGASALRGRAPAAASGSARAPAPPAAEEPAPLQHVELMTGGAAPEEAVPIVIAIHGLGDAPHHFGELFRDLPVRARVLLPAGPDPYLDGFSWFALRRNETPGDWADGIRRAAARVADFIAWVGQARPVVGRPIVTGFSQGGMISFALAMKHPGVIAAAFPVGGVIPPQFIPSGGPPPGAPRILAFHGEADTLVPVGPTREGVERLQRSGYLAELRIFPGVAHQIPPAMRAALHAALVGAVNDASRTAP